jgi:hypothetical protein
MSGGVEMIEKKTLKEWADLENIEILDPDGFDRTDAQLFERLFTKEEFDKGIIFCTIHEKARGENDNLH